MNAQAHLDRLYRRGVRLRLDGDRVRWFAPVGVVSEAELTALRQHKVEVIAILREEDRDRREERAAILEFDAHLSRREAERRARGERHPANGGNAA
jgi:hypothetical protein